jgi:hypothetical protein
MRNFLIYTGYDSEIKEAIVTREYQGMEETINV